MRRSSRKTGSRPLPCPDSGSPRPLKARGKRSTLLEEPPTEANPAATRRPGAENIPKTRDGPRAVAGIGVPRIVERLRHIVRTLTTEAPPVCTEWLSAPPPPQTRVEKRQGIAFSGENTEKEHPFPHSPYVRASAFSSGGLFRHHLQKEESPLLRLYTPLVLSVVCF